jgi:hypothetical protein
MLKVFINDSFSFIGPLTDLYLHLTVIDIFSLILIFKRKFYFETKQYICLLLSNNEAIKNLKKVLKIF